MLTMLFIVIVTYLLKLANLEISIQFIPAIIVISILLISTLILSLIMHKCLIKSKEENDEYLCVKEEPGVIIFGIIYSIIVAVIMCILLACFKNETSMIIPIIISMIVMIIMDAINTIVIYKSYAFDVKESIKDALVRQTELMIYALLIMVGIVFIIKYTLVGALIMFYIIIRIGMIFVR
ncbi:MAG: hypothetical protein K6B70_05225 [Clostridia bacterium]|nr:hypothetical protein [Clostridia bacterium]